MIHTNGITFRCGCTVEYNWDDAVPVKERVHTATRSVRRCAEHSELIDPQLHLDTVIAENRALKSSIINV